MTNVLTKRKKRLRQTQGQQHMTMEAETEVLHLQVRDHQGWPAKHQKLEEAGRPRPCYHRAFHDSMALPAP